jgi:hypothetical protein
VACLESGTVAELLADLIEAENQWWKMMVVKNSNLVWREFCRLEEFNIYEDLSQKLSVRLDLLEVDLVKQVTSEMINLQRSMVRKAVIKALSTKRS